jgi:hypothetical protein
MHPLCCAACCQSISDLYASVKEFFQAMEVMRRRMEDLERVVDDDYKFLNRNVRKLFGMVENMKKRWCEDCGMSMCIQFETFTVVLSGVFTCKSVRTIL